MGSVNMGASACLLEDLLSCSIRVKPLFKHSSNHDVNHKYAIALFKENLAGIAEVRTRIETRFCQGY
jgi:hypothetical protein